MTTLLEHPGAVPQVEDVPRAVDPGRPAVDTGFRAGVGAVAVAVLVIFGSIGVFLLLKSFPTLGHYGLGFFTTIEWNPESDRLGVAAAVVGTVQVAIVALVVAFPLALGTALFISEYAPARVRSTLVALVDLMAAVPSIIYGLWGLFALSPHALYLAHWLHRYVGWIPFFHVATDPSAPVWAKTQYVGSMFIAGLTVAMMVIPIACSVMRSVFAAAPIGEREAALALGATRWGMVRTVVLPFGRGGIIGGTMLGLGRALGETVAVLLILSPSFEIKWSLIQIRGVTISSVIADKFGDATSLQLSALLTAGFVLFVLTLVVNTIAAVIVGRSRSGAATEI